jgi:hypothetical protein
MSAKDFACKFCKTNRLFNKFPDYFRHITLYHAAEPNFKLTCDISNFCGVTYKNFTSYKMHVHRRHKLLLHPPLQQQENNIISSISTLSIQQPDATMLNAVIDENDGDGDAINSNINPEDVGNQWKIPILNNSSMDKKINLHTVQQQYTKFLLEMREQHILPQMIIQSITNHIVNLLDIVIEFVEEQAKQENVMQHQSAITTISIDMMRKSIKQIEESIIFSTRNEYQFLQSCKKFFDYSPPIENILSSNQLITEYSYHVSIKNSLRKMLEKDDLIPVLLENIQNSAAITRRDSDLMFSFRDGTKGEKINKQTFLIQLYVDGIGVTNPIGPKKDQHKLTLVYFTLEDIPDTFRSILQCINLVAICHTKYLNNDIKIKKFYNPIVSELNDLQSAGLIINTFNSQFVFTFTTVAADNLAAHEIGGFQETFSSGYICRRCLVTYENRLIPLTDVHFIQRTDLQHQRILKSLENNPHVKSMFGVAGLSPLNDLHNFDSSSSLPGDVMHDFFEGNY